VLSALDEQFPLGDGRQVLEAEDVQPLERISRAGTHQQFLDRCLGFDLGDVPALGTARKPVEGLEDEGPVRRNPTGPNRSRMRPLVSMNGRAQCLETTEQLLVRELGEVVDRTDRAGHKSHLSRSNELSPAPRRSVRTMVRVLLHLGAM